MKIKINSVHFDADKKLIEFINKKIEKVSQFYEGIIGAEVTLKLEKDEKAENKLAEIRLEVPGSDNFAKKNAKSFEEAVDDAIDALKKQLEKHKEKLKGK